MKSRLFILAIAFSFVASCSSVKPKASRYTLDQDKAPTLPPDISDVPPITPKLEPLSRYGNSSSYVVHDKRYYVMSNPNGFKERGIASWYGQKFHGHRTSSGETYDMYSLSAAHKQLPLPSYVRVTNLHNGKNLIVRANDRGPFHENRVIDLSYTAASRLGILKQGTAPVEIEFINPSDSKNSLANGIVNHYDQPLNLYLQVGAFGNQLNAQNLLQKVATLTPEPVTIETVHKNDHSLFRVRIGPIDEIKTIDQLTEKLKTINIVKTHVVIP